jgi:hypothetical protein
LYDVMAAVHRADDRVTAPEVIREVAERTGVTNVIVGSYLKAGDAIRINVRLREAKTGRIISSERVDGPNESSLFAMVDDLRRIRIRFNQMRAATTAAPGCRNAARRPRRARHIAVSSGFGKTATWIARVSQKPKPNCANQLAAG